MSASEKNSARPMSTLVCCFEDHGNDVRAAGRRPHVEQHGGAERRQQHGEDQVEHRFVRDRLAQRDQLFQ